MYGQLPQIDTADGGKASGFPVQILNPPKIAVLRLLTNAELMGYLAAQRSIARDLGRRQIEREEIPNPEADLKLFNAMRTDKGEAFDADEAAYAIGLITRHCIDTTERVGNTFVIGSSENYRSAELAFTRRLIAP